MSKRSTSKTSDEYPKVTRDDMARSRFRVGLKDVPRKQRINIMLDTGVVEFFKSAAGPRGYQTLINEALKRAMLHESLEDALRRVLRDELIHAR